MNHVGVGYQQYYVDLVTYDFMYDEGDHVGLFYLNLYVNLIIVLIFMIRICLYLYYLS